MIYRKSHDYKHHILLAVIYYGMFAYDIEFDRDFFTWLWLLGSILNFAAAMKSAIDSNKLFHTDDEIIAIAEYIHEVADHRGWENAEYFATEKFGEEKTQKALEYLRKNGGQKKKR